MAYFLFSASVPPALSVLPHSHVLPYQYHNQTFPDFPRSWAKNGHSPEWHDRRIQIFLVVVSHGEVQHLPAKADIHPCASCYSQTADWTEFFWNSNKKITILTTYRAYDRKVMTTRIKCWRSKSMSTENIWRGSLLSTFFCFLLRWRHVAKDIRRNPKLGHQHCCLVFVFYNQCCYLQPS